MSTATYQEYMQDALDTATLEMNQYFEKTEIKESYVFRDNLQLPNVTPILKKSKKREELIQFIGDFVDSHAKELSTPGPVHMITFLDKEISFLYTMFGTDREKIIQLVGKMYQGAYGWDSIYSPRNLLLAIPHKCLLVAMLIDSVQNNDTDLITCCEYLFGFTEYPLIFSKYWPLKKVNEEIMNYTIDHLGNRFRIKGKKLVTLLDILKYDTNKVVSHWIENMDLKSGKDDLYPRFINAMRSQISNHFASIKNEYMKNAANNASQHSQLLKDDEEKIIDRSGHASNIATVVNNTYNRFITGPIYEPFIKSAAKSNQVDKSLLTGFLNQIFSTKKNELERFIECIITSYFNRNPTITTIDGEFVSYGLQLYKSIATSKDQMYIEINTILNYWMNNIIEIKNFSSNKGTHINYRRSIFNYMIWMINHHNKRN